MKTKHCLFIFIAALFCLPITLLGQSDIIPAGLAGLADLSNLCFWHDGIHTAQQSSHDESGRNMDFNQFHGKYRGQRILARIDGPGVIYRVWSAKAMGKIYFYFDGEDRPRIECEMEAFLKGQCATMPEFHVGRDANYYPIPFEKSILVTATNFPALKMPPMAYYQITYQTFDKNPGLKSYSGKPGDEDRNILDQVLKLWNVSGQKANGGIVSSGLKEQRIEPGKTLEFKFTQPGYIKSLSLINKEDNLDPLSDLQLRIYWDGADKPAVDSPADAFFGNKFDARRKSPAGPYNIIPFSADSSGYTCRLVMPFNKVRVVIENKGRGTKSVELVMNISDASSLPANAMRLHAQYKEQEYPDELTRKNTFGAWHAVDQSTNYVLLDHDGQGYYVGCFMYVKGLGELWWGEGDEMDWVDNGPDAVIRGTGTEDEFNWSWGFTENRSPISGALLAHVGKPLPFYSSLCLQCMPEEYKTTPNYNAVYRFRISDYITFTSHIKVSYERLGASWYSRYPGALVNLSHFRGDDYASVAFWYEK